MQVMGQKERGNRRARRRRKWPTGQRLVSRCSNLARPNNRLHWGRARSRVRIGVQRRAAGEAAVPKDPGVAGSYKYNRALAGPR